MIRRDGSCECLANPGFYRTGVFSHPGTGASTDCEARRGASGDVGCAAGCDGRTRRSAVSITSPQLWRANWGSSNRGQKKIGAEWPRVIQLERRHEFASTDQDSTNQEILF